MPARRGLLPLAYISDRQRRDGFSQLVVRREYSVIPMPVVERRAEAMQEGDAAEPPAGHPWRVGCRVDTGGGEQEPLDLVKEDPGEGGDGRRPIGEEAPQSLRHEDHPLPHGYRRDDVILSGVFSGRRRS